MAVNIEPDLFEATPPFLPVLQAGETLYSWCARYHHLSGNHFATHTSLQLFGSSTAGFMQDLPSHLSVLVKRTGGQLGDVEALAHHHTLLGFYSAFRPEKTIRTALESMAGPSVEHLKFRLALPSSRLGASHPLKACPVCMQEDRQHVGVAYWHLEHQWPAVWLCMVHQAPLWLCAAKTKILNHLHWLLPEDIEAQYWENHESAIRNGWHILERMAHYATQCHQIVGLHLDPLTLRYTYLAGLKKLGWLRGTGMIRMKEMRTDFIHQTSAIETIPGFGFITAVKDEWGGFLRVLLHADRSHKHPVKHLLLMAFLFRRWQDFWETYQAMLAEPPKEYASKLHRDDDPRRQELADLVRKDGLTISESASHLGVTLDIALHWARKDNLPYRRRPREIPASSLPALHTALHRGDSREDVAKCAGISVYAVTRFLDNHPNIKTSWTEARLAKQRETYRMHFLEVLGAHPGASLTFLRALPDCGYTWLYRHDRDWLSEHLPSLWLARQKR